jgi:NAD(P)-dependent dehydrogenase (short-subunit alcohol dehydrogenase family)
MTDSRFGVDGRTAIVTGGSRGIGRAIVERFAIENADVVVCSRQQDGVDAVEDELADAPGQVLPVECDVRDREAVESMIEASVDAFGSLDVLVNNAGASFMADFEDISENGWKTILDINLHGTFHCAQAAGTRMRESGGGVIVNFASRAGLRLSPGMSHYGAAKAAIINLTASLANEWASDEIRVNCIAPGLVATPGVETQMGITADDIDRDSVDRRVGTTEEIADVTQFLVSPASSYINGETIPVKGVPRFVESTGE